MTTLSAASNAALPDGNPSAASRRVPWRTALLGAVLAALTTGFGMYALRFVLQVRSVPERLLEWLLLFVTPEQFEMALQRFGFDAKRYALGAAIVGMLGVLGGLGYLVLRRGWPPRWIAVLGIGLWLFVMLVIMPLTSAGPFALDLLDGKGAAIGGYLGVALSFAAVLTLTYAWSQPPSRQGTRGGASHGSGRLRALEPALSSWRQPRRGALALLGSAGAAYLGTYLTARLMPRGSAVPLVALEDPQEPVPSGGIDPPNPHPNVVGTPVRDDASPVAPARAAPTPVDRPEFPEPAAVRQVARDKDGSVLPTGRPTGQLASAITSNDDFYVVTKNAAGDPFIRPGDWRLLIDGDVDRPMQLDYATLRQLPAIEITKTLECISNYVGKPELAPFGAELIGTATWIGVPVRDILGRVGVKADAAWVAVLSADEFTSALPLGAVMDPNTILVYEMNGGVLPREHGYPARLLVPGRYGMKNAKWVVGLRPLRREFTDWYGQRSWSKQGIVQTMSRIDAPATGATLSPGPQVVAGIAYGGTRGVRAVEYSADGGQTWATAELLEPGPTDNDRWVRWRGTFTIPTAQAEVTLVARATDGEGQVQISTFSLPEPDGGTGWPEVTVRGG